MIPVFEARIDMDDSGIYKVSLVDFPAVESDFVYFDKQAEISPFRPEPSGRELLKLAIANEEQRLVTGVLMRADFPIYRCSKDIGEYYIVYSKDTIKIMAEKMMADNTFNNINLQHEDGTDVEGINLVEIFIKDTDKGIDPKGFEYIENGSLFATYKVNVDSIWEQIKDGTFRGFSLEGLFDLIPTDVALSKQEKNKNTNIMKQMLKKLVKSFLKFGSTTTTDGIELYWMGAGELAVGDEVYTGEDTVAEDGEYALANSNTVIVVKNGIVEEIRELERSADDTDENFEKKKTQCEETKPEDKPEETKPEDKPEETVKLEDVTTAINDLGAKIDTMIDMLKALAEKPAATPVAEEYTKVVKNETAIPAFGSRSRNLRQE